MIIPKHLIMMGLDDNNHSLIAYCRMHGIKGKIYTYIDSGNDFKNTIHSTAKTVSIHTGYMPGCYKYPEENKIVIPSENSIRIYNIAIEEEKCLTKTDIQQKKRLKK